MLSLLTQRPQRTPIGLDIGASGVRAVQLHRRGDRYVVTQDQIRATGVSGAPGGEASVPEHGARLDRVRSCVKGGAFRGDRVVVELNPPAVEFHALELPAAVVANQDEKMAEVVRWEVERLMREPVDRVEIRHWSLPPTQVPAPKVIGVAARHEAVLATLETCDGAGLVCLAVETGAAALSRVGTLLNDWNSQDVWGVLDLGFEDARLVLCVDGVPVLVRRAGSGGRAWTKAIADALQLSTKAAEVQKCEQGIALSGRGVRTGSNTPPARKVASILLGALRSELKSIASGVKRSYEYVLSCYPDRRAGDLVLVGGGAAMQNLPEFMSDALGIPVRRASDYLDGESCRLQYALHGPERFDLLASAIGLAIAP